MAREFIVNTGWGRKKHLREFDRRAPDRKIGDHSGVTILRKLKATKWRDGTLFRTITEQKPVPGAYTVSTPGISATVRNAKEVKERIRRIRPTEAAELDKLDAEIQALRDLRRNVLARAWQRAHVVTYKEVAEWAEEWEQNKKRR